MCNVWYEDMISPEEPRSRLKLKSIREYLQDRILQWFGHLERIEECTSSSKYRNFKVIQGYW